MDLLKPVFVIGSPRSGTSLLRLILTSHTKVVVPPECGFIVWLHDKYRNWSICNSSDIVQIAQYLDDLYECKKFDTWNLDRELLEAILIEQQPIDYASLSAIIVLAFARNQSKEPFVWGDKNNFHTHCLPVLDSLYPQARFLHLVRDGRDVACSYRDVMHRDSSSPYAPNLAENIDSIAAEWSANVLQVDGYLAGLVASRRYLIRYEDLVQNPKPIVMKLCNWLGVAFEDCMLSSHEANRKMKLEPELTLDWKRRTLEPISASTVGRYRKVLSELDNACFESLAGNALNKFGYISDDFRWKGLS